MSAPRSLFLSHGAPTLATSRHVANGFIRELGRQLPRPRAVLVVSPHWMTRGGHAVKRVARHAAWHDFNGFPADLYQLAYAPPGDATLADRTLDALRAAGLPTAIDDRPQLDHGVWVPLMLMWPDATVPVVQVSMSTGDAAAHDTLGAALRPLLDDPGVLLIGSGSLVHNLRELAAEDSPGPDWVRAFDHWIAERLLAGDREALLDYRRQAPQAARAHPTDDHLMPLFTAAAAGGTASRLHESYSHGGLSMSAFAFA